MPFESNFTGRCFMGRCTLLVWNFKAALTRSTHTASTQRTACARVLDRARGHLYAARSVITQTRSRINTQQRCGSKRESPPSSHSDRATRDQRILILLSRPRAHARSLRATHANEADNTHHSRTPVPAIHTTPAPPHMLDDERRLPHRLPRPPPDTRIMHNH